MKQAEMATWTLNSMVAGTVIFTDTLMVVFTATFIVRLQEVDEGAGADDTEIGLDYPTEVSSFTARGP